MKTLLLIIIWGFTLFIEVSAYNSISNLNDDDSLVTAVISQINPDSVEFNIQSLQNFQTRFELAPNRFTVANWIADRFLALGINDVVLDSFQCHTNYSVDTTVLQVNVVATIPGTERPEDVYIIGGHYDCFSSSNPYVYAPGADDNASGTTAAYELARVIKESGYQPEATIKFISFSAEELMLFGDAGCEHYAAAAFNQGMNIRLMINADMISHTLSSLQNSKVSINYYSNSTYLLNFTKDITEQFSVLTPVNGSVNQYSDSYPFYQNGYPAIYFEEYDFSPYYHSDNDIISNYNMEYCSEVIKSAGATLLKKMLNDGIVPVELVSFTAEASPGMVNLFWITSTEMNNYGFEIQRNYGNDEWVTVGFIPGNGTSTEKHNYYFTDKTATPGSRIFYRLNQLDYSGASEYSYKIEVNSIPSQFALYQNYPNPFNPATKIRYEIPVGIPFTEFTHVTLKVYDVLGREVATLVNEEKQPGIYEVEFDASALANGIYVYRLNTGEFVSSKKMTVLK